MSFILLELKKITETIGILEKSNEERNDKVRSTVDKMLIVNRLFAEGLVFNELTEADKERLETLLFNQKEDYIISLSEFINLILNTDEDSKLIANLKNEVKGLVNEGEFKDTFHKVSLILGE